MSISGLIAPLKALFSRKRQERAADPRHAFGQWGEHEAARHLRRTGYKVLYRNFRARGGGEVDLVCRDKAASQLVFVEVKTRRRDDLYAAAAAVTPEKRQLIIRGALAWLHLLNNPDIVFRFDIVEVIGDRQSFRCHTITNAFQLPAEIRY